MSGISSQAKHNRDDEIDDDYDVDDVDDAEVAQCWLYQNEVNEE